jgi:hypothetical protein
MCVIPTNKCHLFSYNDALVSSHQDISRGRHVTFHCRERTAPIKLHIFQRPYRPIPTERRHSIPVLFPLYTLSRRHGDVDHSTIDLLIIVSWYI